MPQYSIFTSQTPVTTNGNDGVAYTLGTTWYTAQSGGRVVGVRWYFPTTVPSGTVTAALYQQTSETTGTQLATANFVSPIGGTWNTVLFSSPVTVSPNTPYVVAVCTANRYVGTSDVFGAAGITNGPLVAPQSGTDPLGTGTLRNGRLGSTGGSIAFPSSGAFAAANYFVDPIVEFVADPAPYRVYLTNAAAGYTPATKRGQWDDNAATLVRKLGPRPEGTAATAARAETSATNNYDVLLGRWVSQPARRAGELAGQMNWCVGVRESAAAANMFFHWHVYVLAGDTDTVRGVLRDSAVNTTEWISTSAVGRTGNGWDLDAVNVQAGDRLVVELGYRAQNTSTTSYTGTINYGSTGTTDLSLASPNVTTEPGWVEFTDAEGIFWEDIGGITDDFNDGTLDTADRWSGTWVSGGTTPIETGGKLRIYCNTNYAGALTGPWLYFRDTEASWEMVTLANGATATSECYFKGSIDSSVAGTYIGWLLNLKTGVLRANNAVSYTDSGGVDITWNATTHRWLRLRETSGTVYWETSPDGETWTVRRSTETPYWCNYKDLALSFDAHRDAGASDFFEIDNVSTGPPDDIAYEETAGPDDVPIADAVTAVEIKARTVADTAGTADTVTAVEVKARTVADTAGVTDAAAHTAVRVRAAADTADVTDTVTHASALAREAADDIELGDAAAATWARTRTADDSVGIDDAVVAGVVRARDTTGTAEIDDAVTVARVLVRTVTDGGGIDDTVTAAEAVVRDTADDAGIDDDVVVLLSQAASVTDDAAIDDATVAALSRVRGVADSMAADDDVVKASDRARVAADDVPGDDTATRARAAAKTVGPDGVGIVDEVAAFVGSGEVLADGVAIDDAATRTADRNRVFADTADAADAAAPAAQRGRQVGDGAGLTDDLVVFLGSVKQVADDVPASDDVAAQVAWVRGVADSADLTDMVTARMVRTRSVTDIADAVDVVAETVGVHKSLADAATVSDAVEPVLGRVRRIVDDVGLADAVVVELAAGSVLVADLLPVVDAVLVDLVRAAVEPSRTEEVPVVLADTTVPVRVADTTAAVVAGGTIVPVPPRQVTIRIS